jgi:hypothetical protein
MISSASWKRLARWSKGTPKASNSGWCQPAPNPRITRPPLTSSSVVAILANTAGLRNGVHKTSVPSCTRFVAWASADSIVQLSQMPSVGRPGQRYKKWS